MIGRLLLRGVASFARLRIGRIVALLIEKRSMGRSFFVLFRASWPLGVESPSPYSANASPCQEQNRLNKDRLLRHNGARGIL